jgi:lysophospholipase L1-like esterase
MNVGGTMKWAALSLGLLLGGALAARPMAQALERPGNFDVAWEGQAGPWSYGLYVIGDSISLGVPYDTTGTNLGVHTWWRAGLGWSTLGHRTQAWPSNGLASFEDAARSPARVVFVELGTNDTGCMRGVGLCALGDYPRTEQARVTERQKMDAEVRAAAARLLQANKCVIWAGPREIEREDSGIAEAQRFNQLLRTVEAENPGRFFYLDYSWFSFQNADLKHSLDEAPEHDGIHPKTAEGRQVIANLAFWFARAWCGL